MVDLKTPLKSTPFLAPIYRRLRGLQTRLTNSVIRRRAALAAARSLWDDALADRLLDDLDTSKRKIWTERIENVVNDQNNQFIPRHRNAGEIKGRYLTMHNGLRIEPLSYYNKPLLKMLVDNRGVHEPEEERAFGLLLPELPEESVMVELGCYWAFYSMWFKQQVPHAKSYLVEPDAYCLQCGKRNFAINGFEGDFTQAFVGSSPGEHEDGTEVIGVDAYLAKMGIDHVQLLHSDIQGAEAEMLVGAKKAFEEEQISFVFISTHSNALHGQCLDLLRSVNYRIVRETTQDLATNCDGLIVACSATQARNSALIQRMSF